MQISIGLNKKDLKLSQGTSSSRTTKTNFLPDIKKKKYYNNGPGQLYSLNLEIVNNNLNNLFIEF